MYHSQHTPGKVFLDGFASLAHQAIAFARVKREKYWERRKREGDRNGTNL
jgi:hypothetical protein